MMFFDFDWDANKARANLKKHGVSFRMAASVFRDPLALAIFDEAHSDDEERWITLGRTQNGQTLVVVHTSESISTTEWRIRIISARKADRQELRDYEQAPR
ncbi:MAG: BrnT family toxin [Acidiferrobacteraceae bacterium]